MNDNIGNRQMPVFISSTFRDMQEERDILMKRVFPRLSALASDRLVTMTPIDLRWGITGEDAQSGRVIELCLREIERCQPFFVGILGSRYGWCPGLSDLSDNTMLFDQYDWLKDDIGHGLSVTEIEMQYAVLRNSHHPDAVFFIKGREGTPEAEDPRIRKLTDSILSRGRSLDEMPAGEVSPQGQKHFYYAFYDSPEAFESIAGAAMEKILDIRFPLSEAEDIWTREDRAQQAFLRQVSDNYVSTAENEATEYLFQAMTERYLMISGSRDCFYGKSAFLADWIKRNADKDAFHILFHAFGVGYMAGNLKKALERLSRKVAGLYGLELPADTGAPCDWAVVLSGLLQEIKGKKPLFLILDGLQHLSDYDGSKMLDWMPAVPDNVSVIVTAPYHDATQEVFYRRFGSVFLLPTYEEEEERTFVENYLKRFGKKLSATQTDAILSAYSRAEPAPRGPKDFLTLKSLLNELLVFGSYEQLDERIAYYCEGGLAHFYPRMFARMEHDFGETKVRTVLELLLFSRDGLSEQEIIGLSGATPLQWSSIFHSFSHLLSLKSGRYYIDKLTIRTRLLQRYGADERKARQRIVGHFAALPDRRSKDECLFQYYQLKDFDALYQGLIDVDTFSHLLADSPGEVFCFWQELYAAPERRYRMGAYAQLDVPIDEDTARTFAEMGQFAKAGLGDGQSARALFSKSKEIYESLVHYDFGTLSEVYMELGENERALDCMDKVFGVAQWMHTPDDEHYPTLLRNRGILYYKKGDVDGAIDVWTRLLELPEAKTVGCSAILADAGLKLSLALLQKGDKERFKEQMEKTIGRIEKVFGEKHAYMGEAYWIYGSFHEREGHRQEALFFHRKAADICKLWYTDSHPTTRRVRESIGHIESMSKQSMLQRLFSGKPGFDEEFLAVLDFYEGTADDLYQCDTDWEEGMIEYQYTFRYRHECLTPQGRHILSPGDHVYVRKDSQGRYHSAKGKIFDCLKDAQVHYLFAYSVYYEQFCRYKGI